MGVCLLFPLFFCWSLPPGCLGIKVASGSLKYFLLGAVVLVGLGTSASPLLSAWMLARSKPRRLLLVSLQLLVA